MSKKPVYRKIYYEWGFEEGPWINPHGFNGSGLKVARSTIYEGNLVNSQYEGFGKFTFIESPENSIFDDSKLPNYGEDYVKIMRDRAKLYDNIAQGKGIKRLSTFIGQFEDGYPVSGQFLSPNLIYTGEFLKFTLHGLGKIEFKNSNIRFEGQFDNNKIISGTWTNLPPRIKPEQLTSKPISEVLGILFPGKIKKTHKD